MGPTRPLQKLLTTPPHRLPPKVWKKIRTALYIRQARRQDMADATYLASDALPRRLPDTYRPVMPADLLRRHAEAILTLAARHREHQLNLLGSGWVQVAHGLECAGFAGRRYDSGSPVEVDADGAWLIGRINDANLGEAQRLWRLVDAEYQPIDWQLDFKSGYRWREGVWYRDVVYGTASGADVKVPWELARMQHAPALALAHAVSELQQTGAGQPFAREFRNQVLDFLATNPPRYGVNWSCTMDVAIRVVNWLLTHDLFRGHGAIFDDTFESAFARSVYEHGRHIVENLEWNEQMVGNHFLADVAGLLIVAAHLSASTETDRWLVFAAQQLLKETAAQFHADGSNFEASTCYHRLSAEMVVYATAVLLGVPAERWTELKHLDVRAWPYRPNLEPVTELLAQVTPASESPLPAWFCERLEKMAAFTIHATTPSGKVVQVGDNDSGRFVRLLPELTQSEDDNALDHRSLVAAINGVFQRPEFDEYAGTGRLETAFIAQLAGRTRLPAAVPVTLPEMAAYPEFGLYLFRRPNLFLSLRCGPIGQNGHGGHAHRDQLSFELCLNGVPMVIDPGSYVYTPWPEMRYRFRSTRMHSTLSVPGTGLDGHDEPTAPLFTLADAETAEVVSVSAEQFIGVRRHGGPEHRRVLRIADRQLNGSDECATSGVKMLTFPLAPGIEPRLSDGAQAVELYAAGQLVATAQGSGVWSVRDSQYSPAYGVVRESRALVLEFSGPRCDWTFHGGR